MSMQQIRLIGTTSTGGAATVNAAEGAIFGLLYDVEWVDGDLADGVDAVLSVQNRNSAVAKTLLTLTNANADAMYYPREYSDSNAGAELTSFIEYPVVDGVLRLVIADGGATKTGGAIVTIVTE